MSDESKPLYVRALEAELDKLRPQYCDLQRKYFESRGKRRKQYELAYHQIRDQMTAILWEIASFRDDDISSMQEFTGRHHER